MDTTQSLPLNHSAHPASTHPLVLAAAASVTVLSLAGVAYLAGWLPGPAPHKADAERPIVTSSLPVAPPISVQQTVTLPQEKPKAAVVRHVEAAAPVARRVTASPVARTYEPFTPPAVTVAPAPTPVAVAMPAICRECGTVESVREVAVEARGSGGGAVAGGLVGGIIGNQWGRGATRDIATVLGAVGGAYAGNHIEKSVKESKRYDVSVRFDDGSTRTFSGDTPPAWRSGDRVKLQNGTLINGGGRSATDMGTI
jgi:outer membrane lipoprotein SlyB